MAPVPRLPLRLRLRQGPPSLGRAFDLPPPHFPPFPSPPPPPPPPLPARALAAMLPSGYPSSVAPSYAAYAAWSFAATVFSSTGGVLATQSLLFALGVGAGVAVPASAAWTWACKDGLGQFGGMLYAAALGDRFDADPKRWRMASAVAGDAAGALEVSLALAPGALPFLPLAALANVGRNVAWLSASATRAGLHQALATHGNLADVTAKAGSQVTAAATVGTLLGVALSPALGADAAALAALYAALSAAHVACVAASLRAVALPTLSDARLRLACGRLAYCRTARDAAAHALLAPSDVRELERFLPGQRGADALAATAPAAALVTCEFAPPVERVRDLDLFAEASGALGAPGGGAEAPRAAGTEGDASQTAPSHPCTLYIVAVGAPAPAGSADGGAGRRIPRVATQLLLVEGAGWANVLTGHLHAQRAAAIVQGLVPMACACAGRDGAKADCGDGGAACDFSDAQCRARAVAAAGEWVAAVAPSYLAALQGAGWWVRSPLLERGSDAATRRVVVARAD